MGFGQFGLAIAHVLNCVALAASKEQEHVRIGKVLVHHVKN